MPSLTTVLLAIWEIALLIGLLVLLALVVKSLVKGKRAKAPASTRAQLKPFYLPGLVWLAAASLWFMLYQLSIVLSIESPSGMNLQCQENLRAIGKAMLDYHNAYGRFPPAYLADSNGRPMHSWRVLLLPFLGHEDTYKQYHFDEAWNSMHNWQLISTSDAGDVFICPADHKANSTHPAGETSYVLIVGKDTISDGPHSVRLKDIIDGPVYSIMVAEMATSDIHWAEPRELRVEEMSYHINDPKQPGIRSRHAGNGAYVLYCDRAVGFLEEKTEASFVKALTTIAGGEDVKSKFFQPKEDGKKR
jgi:hypothetical protein